MLVTCNKPAFFKGNTAIYLKFLLHFFVFHILILMSFNVFTYVALPFLIFETAYIFTGLFKAWRDIGCPRKLFYVVFAGITILNLLVVVPERAFLGELIGTYIL